MEKEGYPPAKGVTGQADVGNSEGAVSSDPKDYSELLGTASAPAPSGTEGVGGQVGVEDPVFEIKGEKVPLSQIMEWKDAGMLREDHTRKTQELSKMRDELRPVAELGMFLGDHPEILQEVDQRAKARGIDLGLSEAGMVPPQSQQGQYPQQGVPQQGNPQQQAPPSRQAVPSQFEQMILDRLNDQEYNQEVSRLGEEYGEKWNTDAVLEFAVENDIPNLEMAYRAMNYEKLSSEAEAQVVDNIANRQGAGVEQTGQSGSPERPGLDTTDMGVRDILEKTADLFYKD